MAECRGLANGRKVPKTGPLDTGDHTTRYKPTRIVRGVLCTVVWYMDTKHTRQGHGHRVLRTKQLGTQDWLQGITH